MRVLCWISALTLGGCFGSEAGPVDGEVDQLKQRVTRLENRVKNLEGRGNRQGKAGKTPAAGQGRNGKAPAGKSKGGKTPGPAPQPVDLSIEGDAKAVVLTNGQRKFKVPGKIPPGEFTVLAAFGEETLAKKGTIAIEDGTEQATLLCDSVASTCTVK